MTLSDLVLGKQFKFGHCFQSIPSSRMIPYSDIFVDFRGFPSPTVNTRTAAHISSEVTTSRPGSPHSDVRSSSSYSGNSCTRHRTVCSAKVPQTHDEELGQEEQRTFKCPQCRYITDRKNNLKRHIVTMHQECTKTLECCGIVFQSKSLLRDHVGLFHRGGYRCQICSRNFCRKALLRRHLTVHSGRKDFSCDLCGYATSHKSNLERHQKVHLRKPTVQSGNSFQPLFGLSPDYSSVMFEQPQHTTTSQSSRLLPRYRLLPDRLRQTHSNSHTVKKRRQKVPETSPGSHSEVLDYDKPAKNEFNTKTTSSAPNSTKRNTDEEISHNSHESSPKRLKTDTEMSTNKDLEIYHRDSISQPLDVQLQTVSSNNSPGSLWKGMKSRNRARKRLFVCPYKCPVCSKMFCFQLDLSKHDCSHVDDDNLSVITAIRKGRLRLLNS